MVEDGSLPVKLCELKRTWMIMVYKYISLNELFASIV